MVRKKKTQHHTSGSESSELQESGGVGCGPQRPTERSAPPQQGGGGGYQGVDGGVRGWDPQSHQRGHGIYVGGRGCGPQQQQYYGGPSEYQDRCRGRPQQGGHGGYSPGGGMGGASIGGGHGGPSSHGPPRSTSQAMSPEVGSSSQSPELSELCQDLGDLHILAEEGDSSQAYQLAPPSMSLPCRPGMGRVGIPCNVMANHFLADLTYEGSLSRYEVAFKPYTTSMVVKRALMKKFMDQYNENHLPKLYPAFDGFKNLYTAEELYLASTVFEIMLDEDAEEGDQSKRKNFNVVIKFHSYLQKEDLEDFLLGKQDADAPWETLKALNTVLVEQHNNRYTRVGRSFYSPSQAEELVPGLVRSRGFFQSIRPTQMGLSLNIDMSYTTFIEPQKVIEFVAKLLNIDDAGRSPLSDADRVKIDKALKGVNVEFFLDGMHRKYCISGLTSQKTDELIFPADENGILKSVINYYTETYDYVIRHTLMPCLQVENKQGEIYLPMEVCKIVEGQSYTKKMNRNQLNALSEVSNLFPQERKNTIEEILHRNAYNDDLLAKEFDIKINEEFAVVKARILPAPVLKYRQKNFMPHCGKWNMKDKQVDFGENVRNWIFITFSSNVNRHDCEVFCDDLARTCCKYGMKFTSKPLLNLSHSSPLQMEEHLREQHLAAMTQLWPKGEKLDLLIVILPVKNGSLYGDLKRICETDLDLVSQCCLDKNVILDQKHSRYHQFLTNLSLKINVKVGGRNTVLLDAKLMRLPSIKKQSTIIFGADVTHSSGRPSIAAVVASQDWPQITKYAGLVYAQAPGKEYLDNLYHHLDDVNIDKPDGIYPIGFIKYHLQSFLKTNPGFPDRIIFYRDGVGESQFKEVLRNELHAIRMACKAVNPTYRPRVTYVVVQKRHHTRLFANSLVDADRIENILPGTVVDCKICHPKEFDFYLCSHLGVKGTSCSVHYHVLCDENGFSADELQSLTNSLCYTYARCTQSVSIVPPVYYAHLLAFRARFYMKPKASDSGPCTSEEVEPLPTLKENIIHLWIPMISILIILASGLRVWERSSIVKHK